MSDLKKNALWNLKHMYLLSLSVGMHNEAYVSQFTCLSGCLSVRLSGYTLISSPANVNVSPSKYSKSEYIVFS